MIDRENVTKIVGSIKDYFLPVDPKEYERGTGISKNDFRRISYPKDLAGDTFAIDGSNVLIFDSTSFNLNYIRAGYVVYHGTEWQKTAITFDNLFAADKKNYTHHFNDYFMHLSRIFNKSIERSFSLKSEEELDRISTFFRDIQEYVALSEALKDAKTGDIILYDGSFAFWKDPYYFEVLNWIFECAEKKNVDILGISKSSKLSWGKEISLPLVKSTDYIGCQSISNSPWYVELSGKKILKDESWQGRTYIVKFHHSSTHAFRVDAPPHVVDHIDDTIGNVSMYSRSAESLGYPHALFRVHQDIKIPSHEREFVRFSLFNGLNESGLSEQQIRGALDYHEILDALKRR